MAIYLVQHGTCLSKETDAEKGLSESGKAETQQIAQVAADYQVKVSRIVHSGKKRAQQTAEIFAGYLKPAEGVAKEDALNPLDDVNVWASKLALNQNIMLVGHLPFMEKLTGFLTTGREDLVPFKFQNSGIVCLSRHSEGDTWFIQWSLSPHIR